MGDKRSCFQQTQFVQKNPLTKIISARRSKKLGEKIKIMFGVLLAAFGVIVCGFMLWGYPSSPTEGYAAINPLGQIIGAIIMFFVLGFIPGWVTAKILNGFGMLRIPREIELLGLDTGENLNREQDETAVIAAEKSAIGNTD